jgi:hypothetical protein
VLHIMIGYMLYPVILALPENCSQGQTLNLLILNGKTEKKEFLKSSQVSQCCKAFFMS